MKNIIRRLFGKAESVEEVVKAEEVVEKVISDYPCPFGDKTAWYAIRNETPNNVIERLKLKNAAESNWKNGIDSVCRADAKKVFVSPQIDGYVLVIGSLLIDHLESGLFKEYAAQCNDFQYFCTYRIAEVHAWAKFADKKPVRIYSYWGESGTVPYDKGELTPEEIELGFADFPKENFHELEDDEMEALDYPDEETVMDISKLWSIDTTFTEKQYEKSTGFLCNL
jgi:hypothetical protein